MGQEAGCQIEIWEGNNGAGKTFTATALFIEKQERADALKEEIAAARAAASGGDRAAARELAALERKLGLDPGLTAGNWPLDLPEDHPLSQYFYHYGESLDDVDAAGEQKLWNRDVFEDESGSIHNSRDYKAFSEKMKRFTTQNRKMRVNLVFICQKWGMIDINLRRLATRVVSIRRFLWFTLAIPRERWDVSGNEGDQLHGVEWSEIKLIERPKHSLEGRSVWGQFWDLLRASRKVPGLFDSTRQVGGRKSGPPPKEPKQQGAPF